MNDLGFAARGLRKSWNRLDLRCLAASFAVLALHWSLSLRFPEAAGITPIAWSLLYAIAMVAALRQIQCSTPEIRWKWRLVATNLTLSVGCFVCIAYAEYIVPWSPAALWLNNLFRSWKAIALLLAVCTPEEAERPLNRLIDILEALLIALIFFVLLSPGLFHPTNPRMIAPESILVNRYNDSLAILLALVTLLAVFTAKTHASRHFHTVLAVYLWIGVPSSIFTNEFVNNRWNLPPASATHVVGDLAPVAFLVALPFFRDRLPPRDPSRALVFIRLGASVLLPFFAMLASMLLAMTGQHPVLGIAAGLITLALYGLRSTYGQFQLLDIQTNLETANRRLELLSQRDPLTSLYNRRWFDEHLDLEWKRVQRGTAPLSLLLIDVDHFKLYNDNFGHAQGDLCLQTVASLLAELVARGNDALVRYGGEEFVAMLPSTAADGALQIAQAMQAALEARAIPHPANPHGRVTVSIGIATAESPAPGMTAAQLVVHADQALYRAKAEGRNRIHQA